MLKTLHNLGLDSKEKIQVKGVEVAPRDVVAASLPNPATLGDRNRENVRGNAGHGAAVPGQAGRVRRAARRSRARAGATDTPPTAIWRCSTGCGNSSCVIRRRRKRRQLDEVLEALHGIGMMLMDINARLETVVDLMKGGDDEGEPDA